MTIEVDGFAIPLEPGKTYLVIVNEMMVNRAQFDGLLMNCHKAGIRIIGLTTTGSVHDALRIVQVEQPETESLGDV